MNPLSVAQSNSSSPTEEQQTEMVSSDQNKICADNKKTNTYIRGGYTFTKV